MKTESITNEQPDIAAPPTTFILHAGGETRIVKGSAHDTFASLLERAALGDGFEDVNVFVGDPADALDKAEDAGDDAEDAHEPVKRHQTPAELGHKGGGVVHVHCHTCRRVKTSVVYNGVQKRRQFSPAASVETVRRWAVKKFKIPPVDAEKLFLWLSGAEQSLDGTKHVGDLAAAPACKLELLLLPDPRING